MTAQHRQLVVTLNCTEFVEHFAACSALPVEVRHLKFDIPWQEIAARRSGQVSGADAVSDELRAAFHEAEVMFAFAPPRGVAQLAPKLRWVETPATGYDQLNGTGLLESEVTVTTVGGLFAGTVAEQAFALLLSLTRRSSEFRALQLESTWKPLPVRELEEMTLGIVGLGNIGRAVAKRAKSFGMRVLAARRVAEGMGRDVDAIFSFAQLKEMLSQADVVIVSVTGTAETTNLLDSAELAAMKPGALLINVARGIVVNETALLAALRSGHLGGAGLDVFAREPLPSDHPFWSLPNVILTPHVAITTPSRMPRAITHFVTNLRRYCSGEPLQDVVNRS